MSSWSDHLQWKIKLGSYCFYKWNQKLQVNLSNLTWPLKFFWDKLKIHNFKSVKSTIMKFLKSHHVQNNPCTLQQNLINNNFLKNWFMYILLQNNMLTKYRKVTSWHASICGIISLPLNNTQNLWFKFEFHGLCKVLIFSWPETQGKECTD